MKPHITNCYNNHTNGSYCSLSPTCKGWGCKLLLTQIPSREELNKTKLFIKVYKEAKDKGVLNCPAYHSIVIEEVIEAI